MGFIWTIVIGFIAGVIAKFIMPGKNEPSGFVLTTILGIVGAFVASYLGQALGWYSPGEGAGRVLEQPAVLRQIDLAPPVHEIGLRRVGPPLDVLVRARSLADEHQVGVGIADAEHDLPPALAVQLAPGAVADIRADGGERLGGIRGERHGLALRPFEGVSVAPGRIESRRDARR